MPEGVFSFHVMHEACLADKAEGWRHFVRNYALLARQLLRHYFASLDQSALLAQVFREARANEAQLWRTFAGASEKEFLLHFRRFLLEQGRAARGPMPETPLTVENFWALLKEFPPLQREILALSFRRYPPEALSLMLKFEVGTAHAAMEQAREKLRVRLGDSVGPDFLNCDHDALFAALEGLRGEKCVPDKLYARIVDGQITWREREDAERHIEDCPYCLNRFAEFREVTYFYRTLPPADEATLAALAAALGLPASEAAAKKKTSWWRRLLGR